ncbi:MAG TPA: bifunctional (p)ppGpp synthetase/guanosine-3',5'-bis(diphosphate) 3'-pyrophosphohydrolase [Thermodesulfobacteriota bacterium]|nr:bifunctional (p)ppGpp synthetase/guanosine-3',5'-bis(diphosphate) 3'-pyrophosphohydrolase [Thermodesulfobacteriota bacterium]
MLRLNDIVEKVNSYLYLPENDIEILRRAYVYSAKVHADQKRSSGEPYLSHPLEVSGILADMKLDLSSIATGLLHDTVEDTLTTPEEIESLFGKEIAFLVDGVTKISRLPVSSRVEEQAESFRKLILATAKDIRVVLIKLADRLHNMRTLEHLPEDRRKRIAKETQEIYAPLAHRLGIYWIATDLEDLSFRFLNPDEYENLSNLVSKRRKEWEKYVEEVKGLLTKKLEEFGIKAEITGRFKHIYGIYNKMRTQDIEFDKVYDIIAFRIITNSLRDCYEILGAVHSTWKPVPGRFRDFIALPKVNGYQSLHTTVIGPFGERMEIQIRTKKMHQIAEYGIAAHWKYKEGKIEGEDSYKVYASLRQLLEWKDIKDPTEFMEAIKGELIADMVYVFTPKGDLKELPSGATPVDFAYSIHTEVGNRCTRALINGRLVPLDYKLKSGATVEIITAPDKQPNRDWLKFVVTSRAKTKIRSWLRNEEREQSKVVGKSICERKFKQHGLDFQKMLKDGQLEGAFQDLKLKDVEELYLAVAFGKFSVSDLLKHVLPKEKLERAPEKESRLEKIIQTLTRTAKGGVLVKGFNNVMIRFGNCCAPLPGEPIVGYITRGRGITIHRHDCSQFLDVDPARKVDVEWDRHFEGQRLARIVVICADNPGMLSSITRSIALSDINISKAEIHSTEDNRALGTFEVSVSDLAQLERLIGSIKKVKGVISVERVAGVSEL